MASIKEILSKFVPTERGVYTGKDKPEQFCTFVRVLGSAVVSADDEQSVCQETYRVTIFSKIDFEELIQKIVNALKAEGCYINSLDGENYETETGYWQIPITIQIIKERKK